MEPPLYPDADEIPPEDLPEWYRCLREDYLALIGVDALPLKGLTPRQSRLCYALAAVYPRGLTAVGLSRALSSHDAPLSLAAVRTHIWALSKRLPAAQRIVRVGNHSGAFVGVTYCCNEALYEACQKNLEARPKHEPRPPGDRRKK